MPRIGTATGAPSRSAQACPAGWSVTLTKAGSKGARASTQAMTPSGSPPRDGGTTSIDMRRGAAASASSTLLIMNLPIPAWNFQSPLQAAI